MSKEERFIYFCDCYDYDDYDEIIYDTKEDYNYVSLGTVVKILNQQDHENKILAKALELMSLVLCTGAREDLRSKINKFSWREDVVKFFKQQAEKEMANG